MLIAPKVVGDGIYLVNGDEYEGTLKRIENDSVWFVIGEEVKKWKISEVSRIELKKEFEQGKIAQVDKFVDSIMKYTVEEDSSKHPGSGWISLYEKVEYKLNPDSSWGKTIRSIRKVLRKRGRWITTRSFSYLPPLEKLEIKFARTIQPDGTIEYLKESAKQEEVIYPNFPLYMNLRRIKIALQEPEIGGICDIKVEVQYKKERVFYVEEVFRNWEPIIYKEVEVRVPKGVELNIYVSKEVKVKFEEKGDEVVYKYFIYNSPKIKNEPFLPSIVNLSPRVVIGMKTSWEEISKNYFTSLNPFLQISPQLKQKAKQLRTLNKIYNYIAQKIRTLPIDLKDYSYIPHHPDTIFKVKYGSFSDCVFLLYAMLKSVGFAPKLVLTSGNMTGERIETVPNIRQFDALLVMLEDKNLILCPVNENVSMGGVVSEYQGRMGLVVEEEGGTICELPYQGPDKDYRKEKIKVKMNKKGEVEVTHRVELGGNFGVGVRTIRYLKEEELRKWFEMQVGNIHPGGKLLSFKTSDLENLDITPWWEVCYRIKDFSIKVGEKYLICELPGIRYSAENVGRKERNYPMDFGMKSKREVEVEIELPKEYKVYYLPENYLHTKGVTYYEAKYEKKEPHFIGKLLGKGEKILFKDKLVYTKAKGKKEEYKEYKKCMEERAVLSEKKIVLVKEK